VIRELDSWVKILDEVDEVQEISFITRCRAHTIIDKSPIELRDRMRVGLKNEELQMPHKEANVARTHFGTHRDTTDLRKDVTIKIKSVQGENQFSQMDQSNGGRVTRLEGRRSKKKVGARRPSV